MLDEVRTFKTARSNIRYVAHDAEGNEYTTFREDIGERAKNLQNNRVRIEYHQDRGGQYENVYLDSIERAEPAPGRPGAAAGDTDAQEAAWRTAVDAAPWLIGEPQAPVHTCVQGRAVSRGVTAAADACPVRSGPTAAR